MAKSNPTRNKKVDDSEGAVINWIGKLTEKAIGSTPEKHRVAVYTIGIIAILVAAFGVILMFNSHDVIGSILIFVGLILIFFIGTGVNSGDVVQSQVDVQKGGQIAAPEWSRVIIRNTEDQTAFKDIKVSLDDLRQQVAAIINKQRKFKSQPEISVDLIRSNIFLPRTTRTKTYCDPINLYIPPHLQINMDNSPDRDIQFRSNEGLTGRTFTLGEAYGAVIPPANKGILK
ncbi:MAG: hypothetical protein ACYC43_01185 [Burkholderiales bacterium]